MLTDHIVIAELSFSTEQPTRFSFAMLHDWVIWQFPRPHEDGMMGAIHPPLPEHPWYPAIIRAKRKEVIVHAHIETTYDSPETAVTYFGS